MKTIHVSTGDPYDITIERGILDQIGDYAKRLTQARRVCVVSDTNVAPLYLDRVRTSLTKAGFDVTAHIFKAGEKQKHLGTIAEIYNTLATFGMTRKDIIVALGGGVCGDMAGFAAASFLRGIGFIQIPTSLLAQVDSSVGGKTGVDLPQGKNLVGAFHQPLAVLIDPDTLQTLPHDFITDGMGEVIKYGCIKDKDFFDFLKQNDAMQHIEQVIETCVTVKRDVVSRDEKEAGERMLLNFGHTLGHAIEKLSDFSGITHGMAVAIGMVLIAKAGEARGVTAPGTADEIKKLCEQYRLPTAADYSFHDMAQAAMGDKKTAGSSINLVLLRELGSSFTQSVPLTELEQYITT